MKLTDMETARLCRGLAMLLQGGVDLAGGVFLLAQEESGPLSALLKTIAQQLDSGASLSDALEGSGIFPEYGTALLRVGEKTGRTEEALEALADTYEENCRTLHRIRQTLAYPALVFVLMLVVVAVLLVKVLPVFDRVYASLGSGLRGTAAGLLQLGQLLEKSLPLLLAMLALLFAGVLLLRLWPSLRETVAAWWKKRFSDRGIGRKFQNARLLNGLSMGIRSGLTMEEAAQLAGSLLEGSSGAARRWEDCLAQVRQGAPMEEAMAQSGFLTSARCAMLKLGGRSGSQDRVLEEIARQMQEEARQTLEDAVARIEPGMVLISSALVGLILLAVMLPLVDIMSTIG